MAVSRQQTLLALACLAAASAFAPTALSGRRLGALRAQGDDQYPATATDVFVGNLRYGTDEDLLEAYVKSLRGPDGGYLDAEVLKVTVPRDEETGKERGYAFVKVLNAEQAAGVADGLDGEEFDGRVLNSNVKYPKGKKRWVEKEAVDPATLDDGGLLASLDSLEDVYAVQSFDLRYLRNACKKVGIKAGGDMEQCSARLWKIKGLSPDVYLDPSFGLVPTRGGKRNAGFR